MTIRPAVEVRRMPGGPQIPLKPRLDYRLRFLARWIGRGFRARTILFWPHRPLHKTSIWKICARLGLDLTTDPHRRWDLACYWENTTWQGDYPQLDELARRGRIVNRDCRDISKRRVGEVFAEAFGYALSVDPLTWSGPALEKNDENATKSDVVVTCPISNPKPGHTYQKVIDTEAAPGMLAELRVPVIDNTIPLVYRKFKPVDNRFGSRTHWLSAEIRETEGALSSTELERIGAFTRGLGLEFGEMDILRDRTDGRIYIVDANNTPWGPPRILPPAEIRRAVERLAGCFRERYLAD
jgi:hypothetical protein